MYVCNNGGFSWIPTRNMIMPGPQPDDYLGGSISGVDMQSGKVETVVDECGEHALRGPERSGVDRHGGLWFPISASAAPAKWMSEGCIISSPAWRRFVETVHGVLPANGIGLSPDENTVYNRGDPDRALWAYEISEPASSSHAT